MMSFLHIARNLTVLILLGVTVSRGQVSVSLPVTGGQTGASIDIPVTMGTVTGLGVTAFQFVMTFDTSIVTVIGIDGSGTLSATFTTVPNLTYSGQLRVASAGITPIVGSGTLLIVKAQLKNAGTSGLNFTDFRFNEGSPLATTVNGKVSVQKINHAPVIRYDPGLIPVVLNQPITFRVSAYDPDSDTLTITWKQDGTIVKSGKDSTYTTTFGGKYGDPHTVVCVVSDPGGMQDSKTWNFTLTEVENTNGSGPNQFALGQNYPNPFNPSTTIRFDVPKEGTVTLEVFNVLGIRVRSLASGVPFHAGTHTITWDGRDDRNQVVPSGIYLYRFTAGVFRSAKKMTLLK